MRDTPDQRHTIIDTLRLSDRELAEAVSRSAAASGDGQPQSMRRSPAGAGVDLPRTLVRICQQRGNCVTYLIKPRDLHANGIVFLHGSFVHEGAKCAVLLRLSDGTPTQLAATVLRCRHVGGHIHELVAVFDRAIAVKDYAFADGSPLPEIKDVDRAAQKSAATAVLARPV